jgi:hypothetical protein
MRKVFNLTTVASGAALGLIIAGVLALIGGAYAGNVVHDQLSPQQIYFPAKGKELPAKLNQYAGQQVDNGAKAKAYANDFTGMHLKGIAGGKTYSQVSAAFMANPKNADLAQQRQTLFMGETLRGMLLSAWGWGMVASVATIAGIALLGIGVLLLLIPLVAWLTTRHREPVSSAQPATPAAA